MAVSGGVDSIAAAYFLGVMQKRDITVMHFNHNLRDQNFEMQKSVEKFCDAYGFNLISGEAKRPLKTEDECRKARIKFFFEYCNGNTLITGHHFDDAVESHILNFLRGKEEYLPIPIETDFGNGNRIIHPFLLKEKQFFEFIVKKNKLERFVVHDETNDVIKGSRRNFIRLQLLPLLASQGLGFKKIVRKRYLERLQND